MLAAWVTETRIGGDRSNPMFAHDLLRFQILLEGVSLGVEGGRQVYVALGNEGKLGEMMCWELERRGAVVVPDPPGDMMDSRFAVIRKAYDDGHEIIGRAEDGKLERFFSDECAPMVWDAESAIRTDRVDLVTFHRGDMLWYPELQRGTEKNASERIADITGQHEYDSHSGPLMMNRRGAQWLLGYDGRYGRKWQSTCVLPPIRALVDGLRVGIMPIPNFRYPLSQFLIEDGDPAMENKRRTQEQIPEDVARYVADMRASGMWPPKSGFVELDYVS